jgi:CxxC motif-containing protein (DUF1111 family)
VFSGLFGRGREIGPWGENSVASGRRREDNSRIAITSLLELGEPMISTYRIVYLVIGLVALVPVGVRGLYWQRNSASSIDPAMAQAGEVLFRHEWEPNDPLCAGGDGLGPVFNARSCVECHNQGGVGGGGELKHNVTAFVVRTETRSGTSTVREGVVHSRGLGRVETLQDVDPGLPPISQPTLEQVRSPFRSGRTMASESAPLSRSEVHLSQRNTPALFGSKLIDEIPERVIVANARRQQIRWGTTRTDSEEVPVGRPHRLANGRIGRFGWKAQVANLSDFVRAACANELGLGNPSQPQPVPLYVNSVSPTPARLDLTDRQCDEITAFCASLSRPVERLPQSVSETQASRGKQLFHRIGCAECHTPQLGSLGGLYSDLLLHRMGSDLVGGGSYGEPPMPIPERPSDEGPRSDEWRTPPLWGVADSAPYLHDGRAATLEEAIRMHGGQGKRAAERFGSLRDEQRTDVIAFLQTLRAP